MALNSRTTRATAVNSLRPTENNWQLDGGTYTNRNFGSAPTLPNPDTLQEFTVLTSNFSAENRGGAKAGHQS